MSYSPIEDRYLATLTQQQFPDMPPAEPSIDGMQLAEVGATKMADYGYSGQRQATMTDYDPTVRERMADFLQAGFEKFGMDRYKARQQAQTLIGGPSSNLPLNTGLADIVPFLGTALQTQEAARMGEESITSAQQGNYGTAAMQAGGAVVGMIPGVAGTVKAGKALAPKAGEMVLDSMSKLGSPVKINMMPDAPAMAPKPAAPVNDMGFYSAVEQAALNIQRKSGTGQAMLNDITKGQDVKLDEVKWIGLDDFLKGKKNVTREEVQQFIAANKVDIQEVTLGGAQPFDAQRLSELEAEFKALKQHPIDDPSFGEDKYDEMIRLMNIRDQSTTDTLYEAADQAIRSAQRAQRQGNRITAEKYFREAELLNTRAEKLDLEGQGMSNPTKFGKYTLPGGENYREILLKLPEQNVQQESWKVFWPNGNSVGLYANENAAKKAATEIGGTYEQAPSVNLVTGYKSSHWGSNLNVLAHIRVNDRVDADGKKMLLVEEVQSDWHQAGRDKGYAGAEKVKGYQVQVNGRPLITYETKAEAEAHIARANALDPEQQVTMSEVDASPQMINEFARGKVPDAPMKDTWYQLALKRVLKYAADNGYERVGLTTGKTNAERFDLSKQLDAVEYKRNPDGGGIIIADDKSGKTVMQQRIDSDEQLADYIGKEASKKLLSQEPMANNNSDAMSYVLNNADLSVGGEGMKKYYDEVYPQFLAKYGKKWGAKVGETTIPTERGNVGGVPSRYPQQEPVRFVDITPEMRQGVGKGQPLFSATAAGAGTGAATMQDKEKK